MTAGLKDPLHGIKLEMLLTDLVDARGWEWLASRVDICTSCQPHGSL
jgi:uncharacterized protein (DUF2132 family)